MEPLYSCLDQKIRLKLTIKWAHYEKRCAPWETPLPGTVGPRTPPGRAFPFSGSHQHAPRPGQPEPKHTAVEQNCSLDPTFHLSIRKRHVIHQELVVVQHQCGGPATGHLIPRVAPIRTGIIQPSHYHQTAHDRPPPRPSLPSRPNKITGGPTGGVPSPTRHSINVTCNVIISSCVNWKLKRKKEKKRICQKISQKSITHHTKKRYCLYCYEKEPVSNFRLADEKLFGCKSGSVRKLVRSRLRRGRKAR